MRNFEFNCTRIINLLSIQMNLVYYLLIIKCDVCIRSHVYSVLCHRVAMNILQSSDSIHGVEKLVLNALAIKSYSLLLFIIVIPSLGRSDGH